MLKVCTDLDTFGGNFEDRLAASAPTTSGRMSSKELPSYLFAILTGKHRRCVRILRIDTAILRLETGEEIK